MLNVIEHNAIVPIGSLPAWSLLLTFEIFMKYFTGNHFASRLIEPIDAP
jgi:hypothetical protein